MTTDTGPAGGVSMLSIAMSRGVVRRAAIMALIVGTILAAINHGDRMMTGALTATDIVKILLTFLVPYGVSTVSSVLTVRDRLREMRERAEAAATGPQR